MKQISILLLLLTALALGGCGKELTAGGQREGEVSAVATDAPADASSARYALGPSNGAQLVPLPVVEGTVELSVDVSLVHESGLPVSLTDGTTTAELEIGSSTPVPLGTENVPVGVYPRVRLTFPAVAANVNGLVLGETAFSGDVTVDQGDDPLEMQLATPVTVRENSRSTVILQINSLAWLSLAQILPGVPPTALVPATAFQEAIEVTVD